MNDKKNTILVVDAEPNIHKMLAILLKAENFKIVSSTCGKQAIRMCASAEPDLILLNLELSDMKGKDVVKALRVWSQAPVIMISTRSSYKKINEALDAGANDYITKPFNLDVLLARINAALRSSTVGETGKPELLDGLVRIDLTQQGE